MVYNADLDALLMIGLKPAPALPQTKIFGALVNLLFRGQKAMSRAGLVTKGQYAQGMRDLIPLMAQIHKIRIAPPTTSNSKHGSSLSNNNSLDDNNVTTALNKILSPSTQVAALEWKHSVPSR